MWGKFALASLIDFDDVQRSQACPHLKPNKILPAKSEVLMPIQPLSSYLLPICLLIGSNVFMTTAWYWHLRYKEVPLISVIFISWGTGFRRVLSGGARQQIWQRGLFARTTQNYSGSHYTVGFRDLFSLVPEKSTDLGSSFRLLADRYRRFFRLSGASITAKMSRRFNPLTLDAGAQASKSETSDSKNSQADVRRFVPRFKKLAIYDSSAYI